MILGKVMVHGGQGRAGWGGEAAEGVPYDP